MSSIPYPSRWDSVQFIDKGWSSDKKYKVTQDDQTFLIRCFSLEQLPNKIKEFEFIEKIYAKIPCSKPIEYGKAIDESTAFMILSFIKGADLDSILPKLSINEQYKLGFLAGKMLREIHNIPLDPKVDKTQIMDQVIQKKLNQLERVISKNYQLNYQAEIVNFIKENIQLLQKQPVVFQHGDYHPGNMIYTPKKTISIIDFNRMDIGDPYEEFLKIALFTVESSEYFSYGQIKGYFSQSIPDDFWLILKLYSFHSALFSILWAESFGQKDVIGMIDRYERIVADYKNTDSLKPKWVEKFELGAES